MCCAAAYAEEPLKMICIPQESFGTSQSKTEPRDRICIQRRDNGLKNSCSATSGTYSMVPRLIMAPPRAHKTTSVSQDSARVVHRLWKAKWQLNIFLKHAFMCLSPRARTGDAVPLCLPNHHAVCGSLELPFPSSKKSSREPQEFTTGL